MAVLPWGDRFETFHDKIGVSLETFRDTFNSGWLCAYADALRQVGVGTLLLFGSDKVDRPIRFIHRGTEARVSVLPTPWVYVKARNAGLRYAPRSKSLAAVTSYLATPLRAVARELRLAAADAILCQEYESPRFDLGVGLGRLLGLPVFATYQGGNQTDSPIEAALRHLSVRLSHGLIIGSQDEIDRVRRAYSPSAEKVAYIPNPVDVGWWRRAERDLGREELGIPKDTRVLVWHGIMAERRKGLDVLLDAWDIIRARRLQPEVLLLLVGTGRNTGGIQRRIAARDGIRWIDRFVLDRRVLRRYLSAADVYVLASRHEGFAVAPLEAMACGLPVVLTRVSGADDLLPAGEANGGVIVPRDDPGALATAIVRLLDDPALARTLGVRARRRVEQACSLETVGSRLRYFLFPPDRWDESP